MKKLITWNEAVKLWDDELLKAIKIQEYPSINVGEWVIEAARWPDGTIHLRS